MSLIEVLLVLSIAGILTAVSVPIIQGTLKFYHLSAAVTDVSGAIQSARYRAVMAGCPYSLALTQGPNSYQIATVVASGTPPVCSASGTFTNVDGPIPWSSSGDVSLDTSITFEFIPNGTVTPTGGSSASTCKGAAGCFVLSNGTTTNTITVSGVGNVSVTNP